MTFLISKLMISRRVYTTKAASIFVIALLCFCCSETHAQPLGDGPDLEKIGSVILAGGVIPLLNFAFLIINITSKKKFRHPLLYFRLPINVFVLSLIFKLIADYFSYGDLDYFWKNHFTEKSHPYYDTLSIIYTALIILDITVLIDMIVDKTKKTL